MSSYTKLDPDAPPAVPHALSEEFEGTKAAFDAAFVGVNWTGITYSVNTYAPSQLYAAIGTGSLTQRHKLRALPAGDFTIVSKVKHHGFVADASSYVGISLTDGTGPGGNQVVACLEYYHAVGHWTRWAGRYVGFGGGNQQGYLIDRCGQPHQYLRFIRQGTTYKVGFSNTGLKGEWSDVAMPLPFTPSQFGVFLRLDGGPAICVTWEFLRYFPVAYADIGQNVIHQLAEAS